MDGAFSTAVFPKVLPQMCSPVLARRPGQNEAGERRREISSRGEIGGRGGKKVGETSRRARKMTKEDESGVNGGLHEG